MLLPAGAPAGPCPRSGTGACHLWSRCHCPPALTGACPRGLPEAAWPAMCPLRPARSPCGWPSRLGPGKPCVSRAGVTNLHTGVTTWPARAMKVAGAPAEHPHNGTVHLQQPGSGEASGAVATWARTGHRQKASESLTRHRKCACALGRAGAPGALGRPSTGLIRPWTLCQGTGRWPGGCGCQSSSLRTRGVLSVFVLNHSVFCGMDSRERRFGATAGAGTAREPTPGPLTGDLTCPQARGGCSPGRLAAMRPAPRRDPVAPSEHGRGPPPTWATASGCSTSLGATREGFAQVAPRGGDLRWTPLSPVGL